MVNTFPTLVGDPHGDYRGVYVKVVNRYPTEDADVAIVLHLDGHTEPTDIYQFVAADEAVSGFDIEDGLTYGSVVRSPEPNGIGIICGWNADVVNVLVPTDRHMEKWQVHSFPRGTLTLLKGRVENLTGYVEGVPPFAPPVSFVSVQSADEFGRKALGRLRRYEMNQGEQFRYKPVVDPVRAERKARFTKIATVVPYWDRITEGQGRDTQPFWKVVPQHEAYEVVLAVLRDSYGEEDLTFLRRISSRNEAYRLAQEIRVKTRDKCIDISSYRPVENTDGWDRIGNMIKAMRAYPYNGDGMTVKHLALVSGLPLGLVALIDAAVISYVTSAELDSLARALNTDRFRLMENHG